MENLNVLTATFKGKVATFKSDTLYGSDIDDLVAKLGFETYPNKEDGKVFVKAPNGKSIQGGGDPDYMCVDEYAEAVEKLSKKLGQQIFIEIDWYHHRQSASF